MNMLSEQMRKLWEKERFFPGVLGVLINPFYFARKGLAKHIREFGGEITGRTLDVGCGKKYYESLFASDEYIGLEIDSEENRKAKRSDFYYDGQQFPFESNSFDSIVSNQVFEHVFNPDKFLEEVRRVLRPDGKMLLTVPFVWDEHEQPHDFARYSSFGIRSMLERHGFEIIEVRKSMDDVRVIFQLINVYIYKKTATSNPLFNVLITILLMAPFNILGELLGLILPRNEDLYLDNIIFVKKPG